MKLCVQSQSSKTQQCSCWQLLSFDQFASALLGQHPEEPAVRLRPREDSTSGWLPVSHRSGLHGLLLSEWDSAGEGKAQPNSFDLTKQRVVSVWICCCLPGCSHQQAPLRPRHSNLQAGSEGVLQADQRPAISAGHWIQELPARRIQGEHFFCIKKNFKMNNMVLRFRWNPAESFSSSFHQVYLDLMEPDLIWHIPLRLWFLASLKDHVSKSRRGGQIRPFR